MVTEIVLIGVKWDPKVVMNSLKGVSVGDQVQLRFSLERIRSGRKNLLRVEGPYRVVNISLEGNGTRRVVQVQAVNDPPVWASVKKDPRKLAPTHSTTRVLKNRYERLT